MSKIELVYWDLQGLCEPIRYLLHYKNVDFDDKRFSLGPAPDYKNDWHGGFKQTVDLDFPNLPYLVDGDVKISQSTAILRYLARKYDLDAKTEHERIRLDVAEQQITDLRFQVVKVVYNVAEYEKNRADLLPKLPEQMKLLSKFLGDRNFILGDRVTYVDFMLLTALDFNLVFDPTCLNAFKNLTDFIERMNALPGIKKYTSSPDYHKFPLFGPMAMIANKRE